MIKAGLRQSIFVLAIKTPRESARSMQSKNSKIAYRKEAAVVTLSCGEHMVIADRARGKDGSAHRIDLPNKPRRASS